MQTRREEKETKGKAKVTKINNNLLRNWGDEFDLCVDISWNKGNSVCGKSGKRRCNIFWWEVKYKKRKELFIEEKRST